MKSETSKKNFLVLSLLLLILVFIGFSIRVINLGGPGFGTDESFHVLSAKSIIETGEPNLPSGYPYKRALLYTKLVSFSFKIFGINEFGARFPSTVFGTLTIILIFFAGKRFFGTPTGVISALLYAFSPFSIIWARECRMYSMFQFFFLFGTLAFYNGFENPMRVNLTQPNRPESWRSPWKFMTGIKGWGLNLKWLIIAGVLFYTSFILQPLTALFGASFIAYLLLMILLPLSKNDSLSPTKNKYIFSLAIVVSIGLLSLVISPKLLYFIKGKLFFAPGWSRGMTFNPIYYLTFLGSTAVFPIGVFFIIGSIQILIRGYKSGLYALVCVVVPLIIITLIPSHARGTRYIYHIFPIIILIAGYSMSLLWKYESKILSNLLTQKQISRYAPLISGVLLSAFLIFIAAPWINYIYRFTVDYYHEEAQLGTPYRNWKDACKYVREAHGPEDIIITTEPLTASFYDPGDIQYILTKNPDPKTHLLKGMKNIRDLNELRKVISENQRGWIIIDAGRFNTRRYIHKDIRDFMTQNLPSYVIDPHGTILVFSWDHSLQNFQGFRDS
jgi:4-amino-4-deoxy-L-arabinose transferase-like glycosyltransferase